jgi:hypothetical protein
MVRTDHMFENAMSLGLSVTVIVVVANNLHCESDLVCGTRRLLPGPQ